jgi:hypothetical protein
MPLYINYSTGSALSNSDQFGNIYIAGASLQLSHSYGPSNTTNWRSGLDSPIGGYTWYRYTTSSTFNYANISSTVGGAPNRDDGVSISGGTNPSFTQLNVGEDVASASLAEIRSTQTGIVNFKQGNVSGSYTITAASLIADTPKDYTRLTVTPTDVSSGTYSTGGGGGTIILSKFSHPKLEVWTPTTDSDLLNYYNNEENTTSIYSSSIQVKDAIANNDDQYLDGEPIRSNLILFMDPNNDNSYSGTGTSVTNIAPADTSNNVDGTLDDSVMYVNPGGGEAAYFRVRSDSSIQRLDFDSTMSRATDEESTLQFFFWSNYDSTGQYGNSQAFFGGKFTDYMALVGGTDGTYDAEAETNGVGTPGGNHDYFSKPASSSAVFTTGSWQSWTSVFSNDTGSNYFNGTLSSTTYPFLSPSTAAHTFHRLGSNSTGTGTGDRGGDIRMGALLLYDRALSAAEIRHNLNIFEQRYS